MNKQSVFSRVHDILLHGSLLSYRLREALWGVSLRLIKPVTEEFGCQIVYID